MKPDPVNFSQSALRALLHLQRRQGLEVDWLLQQGLAGMATQLAAQLSMEAGTVSPLSQWVAAYSAQWLSWQPNWSRALAALPQPIILKGAALCHWLYPEPALRPVGDLDLLIAAEQRPQAQQALLDIGFAPALALDADLIMTQQRYTLQRPNQPPCHIDLHWASSNRSLLAKGLSYEFLQSHTQDAGPGRGLQGPAALLHAACHLLGHHGDQLDAKWLLDIHLLWELMEPGQRRQVTAAATQRGLAPIVSAALTLCAQRTGTRYTEGALGQLLRHQDQPSRHYLSSRPTVLQDLSALPGIRQPLRYLGQMIFPSAAYMTARGFGASPAAYAKRLAGGLRKAIKPPHSRS